MEPQVHILPALGCLLFILESTSCRAQRAPNLCTAITYRMEEVQVLILPALVCRPCTQELRLIPLALVCLHCTQELRLIQLALVCRHCTQESRLTLLAPVFHPCTPGSQEEKLPTSHRFPQALVFHLRPQGSPAQRHIILLRFPPGLAFHLRPQGLPGRRLATSHRSLLDVDTLLRLPEFSAQRHTLPRSQRAVATLLRLQELFMRQPFMPKSPPSLCKQTCSTRCRSRISRQYSRICRPRRRRLA
mmetsp:Transcript_564/g.949  ORF Transcript_564/g.949 Transcript_564/m.949 type:complete len:246 (+) Transcript_564:352-1089(+)